MTVTTNVDGADLQIRGAVLRQDDAGFEEVAAIWDGRHEQRPSIVARCVSAGDVRRAIRYARKHDLEISVRSGGHNPNGYALNEGGMVLDMRLMNGVAIDPVNRRARVGGGVLAGDLAREASEFGLAAVTGMLPDIGFCGLALNGGVGYFTAKYGMAADNIVAATVVTADGQVLRCSAEERPDLLWGLQGAGSNFGVITELEVKLHELPDSVLGGLITWRPTTDELPVLVAELLTTVHQSSDGLYPAVVISTDQFGAPEVMAVLCHVGDPDVAAREISAVRALGTPATDSVRSTGYFDAVIAMDEELERNFVEGLSRYWRDRELAGSPERFGQVVAAHLHRLVTDPAVEAGMTLTIEGKRRENVLGTPARHRESPGVSVKVGYRGAENRDRFTRLVDELDGVLVTEGVATVGVGLMHSMSEVTPDIVAESYGPKVYERLAALKKQYDPQNVFHRNYNIVPARG